MNDIMFRALVGVCFLLALFGLCAITRPHREPKRNVRRVPLESGNTVPRMPNVRRSIAPTPTVIMPAWDALEGAFGGASDEPTLTSPRGES